MYNIKIYDRNWTFLQTLSEKEISSNYTFSASLNSGYSTLTFEYYWKTKLEHKQRIKIYKSWKSIYQWFISWITKKKDRSWEKQIIKANGLKWLLAYIPYPNWNISNTPSVLLRNLLSSTWINFDLSWIKEYWNTISLSASNDTYLSFLDKILKQIPDRWFFIDSENKVWFTPFENKHILTYWNECYNIELIEDSTNYYNKITLKYSWWEYTNQDTEAIEKYWINYLILEENDIKNINTAQLRTQSLLKEKWIITTYKVQINSNFDYFSIKPWDILSIRNTERVIEEKIVKQIQYWKDTANILLDSYESLEQYLKK